MVRTRNCPWALNIADLRGGPGAAYTLPEHAPRPEIGSRRDAALPDMPARFLVEVPLGTIEAFVRFRWLRADQRNDLLAIMEALRLIGQLPQVARLG
jgi:hypothetical protein